MSLFGFTTRRAGFERLPPIAAGLVASIEPLHLVEKSAILMLANMALDLAARTYDAKLATSPTKVSRDVSARAVGALLDAYSRLQAIASGMPKPSHPRHVRCHMHASALAACTVGLAGNPSLSLPVGAAWKSAWEGNARGRDAVAWIRKYEAETGVESVPRLGDGNRPTDADLFRAATMVPSFYRRKPGPREITP